jgi:branched-chain amino acid transport system substrate-binding protein
LVVVLCMSCTFGSPATPAGKALKVGVDLPLSGPEGRAGTTALNGVRYYVDTHPTLAGFTVSLVVADDARGASANPSLGLTNLQALLKDAKVVAMIGPLDAAVARQQIPSANAAGFAMLSPATSNPCLTRDTYMPALLTTNRTVITCKQVGLPAASELRPGHPNNFFRLTTTDELQGAAAADYAFDTLHLLRAAVIADHELYGQGLAGAFTARFQRRGGTVVGRLDLDQANAGAADFLNRVKQERAEAIYFGGVAKTGCAVRAQMASVFPPGDATPFLGGDGIAQDPDCIKAAGSNSAGILATVPIVDAASRAEARGTIDGFRKSYPKAADFGPYTMLGYDAAAVMYAALDKAISSAGGGPPTREAVVDELSQTKGFAGTTGTLGFDPAGDTTNRVVSLYAAAGSDPAARWRLAGTVDYSARLPY